MSETDCCIECWEEFRYDDCGGYNPPCSCGFHCGRCHEIELEREADRDDDEGYYPPELEPEADATNSAVETPSTAPSLTLPPSEPRPND
jgi:hypothetical protein